MLQTTIRGSKTQQQLEQVSWGEKMKTLKITSAQMSVASLALTMLLASLGVSIPNIALPSISKYFEAVFSDTQLIIIGYLLAVTVLIVAAGKIGDLFGRKKIFLIGIVLFSVAALASGFAQSLWMLVFARIIQGLGAAILLSLSIALMSDSVPKEKMGSVMGLMGTMSALGTASGPSLGGFLVNTFGWRSVFFFMSAVGILSFFVAKRFVIAEREKNIFAEKKIDFFGMFVMGIALTSYSLGVTINGGHFTKANWILLAVAMFSIFAFIKVEKESQNPLLRLDLFNQTLSSNLSMNIIVSTVMMSTLVVGPFYLSKGLELTPLMIGAVMTVGPLLSILTGIPSGKAVDLFGAKAITKIGLLLMAFGTTGLFILPEIFGLYGYVSSIFILSPGYQLFQASNNAAVMEKVPQKERGVVAGLLSLSRNIGLISGASVMGSIFSFATGVAEISAASAGALSAGMKSTFFVATILLLIAVAIAFFNNKQKGIL